ncbi:hypothetical protein HY256_07960, partial [Candidatus Sumerlaeota bacterium]|nr:hypothetical protein [Candidatus Sumerlaeota bacterium]
MNSRAITFFVLFLLIYLGTFFYVDYTRQAAAPLKPAQGSLGSEGPTTGTLTNAAGESQPSIAPAPGQTPAPAQAAEE